MSSKVDQSEAEQLQEPILAADALQAATVVDVDQEGELFVKGVVQEPAYRDVWFGLAFVLQVVGVLIVSIVYGRELFLDDDDHHQEEDIHHRALLSTTQIVSTLVAVLVASLLGAVVSTMTLLHIMTRYSHVIVEVSFAAAPCLTVVLGGVFMAVNVETGLSLIACGLFVGAISACFYLCYKRFIPFAASTLKTAVSAVQTHHGLVGVAFGSQMVTFVVTTVFFLSLVGVYLHAERVGEKVPCNNTSQDEDGNADGNDMCLKNPPILVHTLLLFCFFWTQQVVQNVVHCTTAGTVGSWWFSGLGDPSSWCSPEISGSFGRATTYSFGSICFGSLLVAVLQTLEAMVKRARRRRGNEILACVLECILRCMRRWLEYFNSWAFVYVGLYGYDYLTAGKNVVSLFQNRGWSTFVSDRLIFRVLNFGVLAVALFTGGVAALSDALLGSTLGDDTHLLAFFIGFLVGLVLSRCSLFVVESSVRTCIVCFAESPSEFAEHHPELCDNMKAGWAASYPDVWTEEYDLRFENEVTATPLSMDPVEEDKESLVP